MAYPEFLATTKERDAVRAAIGLTVIDLPDPLIDDLAIGQRAELKVKQVVPDFASMTGEQITRLHLAAVYYACVLLAERFKSGAVGLAVGGQGGPIDWSQRRTDFLQLFGEVVQELRDQKDTAAKTELLPDASFSMKGPVDPLTKEWEKKYPPIGDWNPAR